jgi:hypothetical protein
MRTRQSIDEIHDRDFAEAMTPVCFKLTDDPRPLDFEDYMQMHPERAEEEEDERRRRDAEDREVALRVADARERPRKDAATRRARLRAAARKSRAESTRMAAASSACTPRTDSWV